MRTAHIVTTPHEVGDRVLALCGKEHKVKTAWEDIPEDNPICRDCVDLALGALTEADDVIVAARRWARRLILSVRDLGDTLSPDGGLNLDSIAEDAEEFANAQAIRAEAKAEAKKAKQTCTCTWINMENFAVDSECPIHGGQEYVPIAPEEE